MRVLGAVRHFLLPSMLAAILLWGICLLCSYVKTKKFDIKLWGIRYVFITYIMGVFMVTDAYKVFIEGVPTFFMEGNLIPLFYTVTYVIANPFDMLEQIGYNVVLFIPFGFFVVLSFPHCQWKLKKLVIIALIAAFVVEILEYFSGRYFDIDDIIINVFGAVLGYLFYGLLHYFCLKSKSSNESR